MKQDFALDLNGCSKEDRKKVIELAKSVGFKWNDSDRFKSESDFAYLKIYHGGSNGLMYDTDANNFPVYTMPSDWSKIKEALGVSVEPKDGEVYKLSSGISKDFIIRLRLNARESESASSKSAYYSRVGNGYFAVDFAVSNNKDLIEYRKATPEETTKLIEAEHANGYHWDGKELVKIPEYVKVTGFTKSLTNPWYSEKIGEIFPIKGISDKYASEGWSYCVSGRSGGINEANCEPSTLEAYEAQETKKKERSNHTLDSFVFAIKRLGSTLRYSMFDFKIPNKINLDLNCPCYIGVDLASKKPDETVINIIKTDPIGLHAENEGLYVKIKDLEISNNELKVEIETKDKRIAELEGNLIVIGDVANKILS